MLAIKRNRSHHSHQSQIKKMQENKRDTKKLLTEFGVHTYSIRPRPNIEHSTKNQLNTKPSWYYIFKDFLLDDVVVNLLSDFV